jgi:carbonic anhydrase
VLTVAFRRTKSSASRLVSFCPPQYWQYRLPGGSELPVVLQYAVDVLQISHIIVCGHYGCGGIQAAFGPPATDPLEGWIAHIRETRHAHADELASLPDDTARWQRLCELNVMAQVRVLGGLPTVVRAWQRSQPLAVHGWIYDLHDGLLRDLEVSVDG